MASMAPVSSVVSGGVGYTRADAAPTARSTPLTIPPGAPSTPRAPSTPDAPFKESKESWESRPETMNRTARGGEFGIHAKCALESATSNGGASESAVASQPSPLSVASSGKACPSRGSKPAMAAAGKDA